MSREICWADWPPCVGSKSRMANGFCEGSVGDRIRSDRISWKQLEIFLEKQRTACCVTIEANAQLKVLNKMCTNTTAVFSN